MRIVLKPEVKRIKNGYSATSLEFRIAAHGFSPEAAKMNLERSAQIFLSPFLRQGTLEEEVKLAGVQAERPGEEGLTVDCE